MRPVTREEYPLENLHRIVSGVTFFKELLKTDPEQFELLMTQARFVTAEQNEIVLHKGDGANVLYFLLRGELDVIADDHAEEVLGTINPGEPFGVMAMVLNFKRSASIRVSSKNALLAGIEFDHFRHSDSASIFSLTTRITFFRMLNSNIRWALERKKNGITGPRTRTTHPLSAYLFWREEYSCRTACIDGACSSSGRTIARLE